MILVDSSVWIDYFNGVDTKETARLDDYLGSEPLLIGDIILAEVLQGFRRQRDHDRALVVLSGLAYRDLVGRQVALAAAENYRTLRRRGVTVGKCLTGSGSEPSIENQPRAYPAKAGDAKLRILVSVSAGHKTAELPDAARRLCWGGRSQPLAGE